MKLSRNERLQLRGSFSSYSFLFTALMAITLIGSLREKSFMATSILLELSNRHVLCLCYVLLVLFYTVPAKQALFLYFE